MSHLWTVSKTFDYCERLPVKEVRERSEQSCVESLKMCLKNPFLKCTLCSAHHMMTAMYTELHICSLNSSHLALMHVFYNILLLKVNVEHQRKRSSLWSIISGISGTSSLTSSKCRTSFSGSFTFLVEKDF